MTYKQTKKKGEGGHKGSRVRTDTYLIYVPTVHVYRIREEDSTVLFFSFLHMKTKRNFYKHRSMISQLSLSYLPDYGQCIVCTQYTQASFITYLLLCLRATGRLVHTVHTTRGICTCYLSPVPGMGIHTMMMRMMT